MSNSLELQRQKDTLMFWLHFKPLEGSVGVQHNLNWVLAPTEVLTNKVVKIDQTVTIIQSDFFIFYFFKKKP